MFINDAYLLKYTNIKKELWLKLLLTAETVDAKVTFFKGEVRIIWVQVDFYFW